MHHCVAELSDVVCYMKTCFEQHFVLVQEFTEADQCRSL